MNILTQLATQFLLTKTTLLHILKTLNFPEEFRQEFRHDRISIDEDLIRRKIRLLCQLNTNETFQDLFCHEDGIHVVFHIHFHQSHFLRFRISFDIKIIALILNNHQQTIQFMINNIQIKSLNRLLEPFRFYFRLRIRSLIIEEIERICHEQKITYERLFNDRKHPLTYAIDLSNIPEFHQLRERYLIIGNQTILDLIQITYVEHREHAVVLGYRLNSNIQTESSAVQFLNY